MAQSLREGYDARQRVKTLQEQIRSADDQVLTEHKTARLIIEAMDEEDLNKASQIIDKLRAMKGKGLQHLDAAIGTAEAELNKYTGGGILSKAWSKLKTKVGIDNPLVKVMTFASALETGFKQLPRIIKNNVELSQDNADSTLNDLVTDPGKRDVLTNNMLKALSPKGIFGVFKKVPYVDRKMLVADLLNVPIKNLNGIIKQAASGPQTDQVAADMKGAVTGQGGVETKGTQPGAATTGTEPTASSTPAKGTTKTTGSTPTGEKTPSVNDVKAKVINRVKPALEDLGIKNVDDVISALDDLGVLKSPGT